jgi:hypothetical protein
MLATNGTSRSSVYRMARRRGYAVQKSRHHGGLYRLIDPARNRVIFGRGYTATLNDVREYLIEDMRLGLW